MLLFEKLKEILKIILILIVFIFRIIINPFLWFFALFIEDDKTVYYHTIRKFVPTKNHCNTYWHDSFLSASDFNDIEKILEEEFKLIAHTIYYNPKPKIKFLFYEYGSKSWEGGYIYECSNCKMLWELSIPENANRGYFKSINLDRNNIKEFLEK